MSTTPRQTAMTAPDAPPTVGPFSPAVRVGELAFVSGQIGVHPGTTTLVGDDVGSQTRQAVANLKTVLAGGGLTLAAVVKVTVYLADIADWPRLNDVYSEEFAVPVLPARTAIQVGALPFDARVELDVIADASAAEAH